MQYEMLYKPYYEPKYKVEKKIYVTENVNKYLDNEIVSTVIKMIYGNVNQVGSTRLKLAQKQKDLEELDFIYRTLKSGIEEKYNFIKLYKLDNRQNPVELDHTFKEIKKDSIQKNSKKVKISTEVEDKVVEDKVVEDKVVEDQTNEEVEDQANEEVEDQANEVVEDQYVKTSNSFFLYIMFFVFISVFVSIFKKETEFTFKHVVLLTTKSLNYSKEIIKKYQHHINVIKFTNQTVDMYNKFNTQIRSLDTKYINDFAKDTSNFVSKSIETASQSTRQFLIQHVP